MLPFTAESFLSFLAQYNAAVWPAHTAAFALGLAAVLAAARPRAGGDRMIAAILAAAWIGAGGIFHIAHFATLHFAAPAFGILFILQGLWLAWAGVIRGRLAFRFRADVAGWTGLALAAIALVGLPLASVAAGHGWRAAPMFAVTPGPTALFTLGLLLLSPTGVPLGLMAIPVLWALAAGVAAWFLGLPEESLLAPAALLALGLAIAAHRGRARL